MNGLRISELMDDYRDDEFFLEGERAANPDAVTAQVLEQVHRAAPAKKRRMPLRTRVLLAAALAAVMVVLVGAGVPSIVQGLLSGRVEYLKDPDGYAVSVSVVHDKPPVRQQDGRIWFVADGRRTDITDLIDEETPFIYDGCDPDTKLVNYLIIGGTLDNVGWYEYFRSPGVPYFGGSDNAYITCYEADGVRYLRDELTQEQWEQISADDTGKWESILVARPWLAAAEAELHLSFF